MVSLRRKILFYFFIIAFFALSFFVIVYAQGYRIKLSFPPQINMLEKTGMLILKTEPSGARVFLDGEPVKSSVKNIFSSEENYNETPSKIKSLSPKEYKVTLKMQGYHEWEHNINVYPGRITTVSDIDLFKDSLPLKIINHKFEEDAVSPDAQFAINPEEKTLFDLKTGERERILPNIATSSSKNQEILWKKDGEKFLLNGFIIEAENPKNFKNINKNLSSDIKNIQWSEDGDLLYFTDNHSLKSLNLENMKTELIVNESYSNFLIKDGYIFGLSKRMNSDYQLKIRELNRPENLRTIPLPCSSLCEIFDFRNNLINIYDKKYESLYLIRFTPPVITVKETINNVKYFEWINDTNLIYSNNFEIWNYNSENNKKTLYTRISEKISGITTHGQSGNVIYNTDNCVKILSPEKLDKTTITPLICLKNVSDIVRGGEGENIYFNAEVGRQSGYYKLKIK